MKKINFNRIYKEGLILILGSVVYSVAVEVFLSPLKISPGGITGISTALNFFNGFPTGAYIVIFNLPLIILGLIKFGKSFIFRTSLAVLLTSAFIEIINIFYRPMLTDKVVCCLFGGILMGTGLGLIMLIGASTGGVDIIVKLLNEKYNISIGRAFLFIDGAVVLFAALVYGDIQSALYSIVAIFLTSRTVDLILCGNTDSKAIFIITNNESDIKNALIKTADRGVTVLPAFGGFTGRKNNILLCVARNNEISVVRRTIISSDPSAFFFIVNAGDVIGKGFK